MFDISIGKLALLAVIGLVVLGPERLPKVAFVIGRFWRNSQRYVQQIQKEMNTLGSLKEPMQTLNHEIQEIKNSIGDSLSTSNNHLYDLDLNSIQANHYTEQNLIIRKKRLGRQSWRIKSQAIPKWYKLSQKKPTQLQYGAARMRRYRPNFRLK